MKNKETAKFILNLSNNLLMTLLYVLMVVAFYNTNTEFDYGIRGYIVLGIIYALIYHFACSLLDAYKLGNKKIMDIILSQGMSLFGCDFVMFFILSLIEGHILYVRWPYLALFLIQIALVVLLSYYHSLNIRNNFKPLNAVVIYNKDSYKTIIKKLKTYQEYEFAIKKVIDEKDVKIKVINELVDKYECIICADISHELKKKIVKKCYEKDKYVYDVPSITDMFMKSSEVTNYIDTPIFRLNKFGPSIVERFIKRAMDIFGGVLLLILGSPFMLVSAIVIKCQDGGDVFFKQKRLTKGGKEFELIKFRSMIMNAEPEGKMIRAKENDNRITKYGKFIRSTRIDELPQVFNILKGDMSFVGPRALRVEEYETNENDFPEFRYRLKVKAGLTGYAQIYGKYNTNYRDKLLLDIYYIENYSLITDIKLILMSIVNIFVKDSTQGF